MADIYAIIDTDGVVQGEAESAIELTGDQFKLIGPATGGTSVKAWVGVKKWDDVGLRFVDYTPPTRIIPRWEFIRDRLTMPIFEAIVAASKTDTKVEAWLLATNSQPHADLDDEATPAGLDMLQTKGLITQEDRERILA